MRSSRGTTWLGTEWPAASLTTQLAPLTGTRATSVAACASGFHAAMVKACLPVVAAQTLMLRQLAAALQLQCSISFASTPSSRPIALEMPASTYMARRGGKQRT